MDLDNIFGYPSADHIFGTDGLGRDLFSRILYGGQYSLALGLFASVLGEVIGVVIGSIAGYFGKRVEVVIMRIMDVWSSIPSMLLCILISFTLGTGFFNTAVALAAGNVPESVRLIRGQILSERTKEYLEAAESINCSKFSIMFRHLLPNVISPIIVHLTMNIGFAITMAAALSYIGLGVQPPTPEWGALLSDARVHILNYSHLILFPGIFIAFTVLATNLIGDGLRDALDPKLRS
jgi:ABC-type dipeptide/oligopeptide/nickel transport system permease subunit